MVRVLVIDMDLLDIKNDINGRSTSMFSFFMNCYEYLLISLGNILWVVSPLIVLKYIASSKLWVSHLFH